MKLITATFALVALAGSLTPAGAQEDNILIRDGKFVPTISINETHADKIVRHSDWSEVVATGRLTARIVANLANFDPTELAEDTAISVSIGGFQFDATIADLLPLNRDGLPVPFTSKTTGGTSWMLVDKLDRNGDTIYNRNGDAVQVKIGSVAVAWTATTLTINVRILDTAQAGAGSVIDSLNLLGLADDGVQGGTINFANEAVPVSVSFGSASGENSAYVKGITKTLYRTVGDEDFALNSANIIGAADVAVPVLAMTVPADDGGSGYLDFEGTVADLAAATLPESTSGQFVDLEVYVNDPDFAAPIPADELGDPDKLGKRLFSFTSIPLEPGANTVVIVAIDDSGNQTVVTRTVNSTAGPRFN